MLSTCLNYVLVIRQSTVRHASEEKEGSTDPRKDALKIGHFSPALGATDDYLHFSK